MSVNLPPSSTRELDDRLDRLIGWYGDGTDGLSPTRAQWQHALDRPADAAFILVNFFKMKAEAEYQPDALAALDNASPGTGQDAFDRYAAVSMPAMARAGGSFLFAGPGMGAFLGPDEDWDLVVIGRYPGPDALWALFSDPAYRAAYHHRTAALARQTVMMASE